MIPERRATGIGLTEPPDLSDRVQADPVRGGGVGGRPLRIGIDTHTAEDEGTGNSSFTRNLVRGLATVDAVNEYLLYAENPSHPFYAPFREMPNVRVQPFVPKAPAARVAFSLGLRTWKDRIDVLHVVYFAPLFHRGGLVVTIHDNAFRWVPASFRPYERIRSRVLFAFSAKRANRILTGSLFSKQDICRVYGLRDSQVTVTYPGVDRRFRPMSGEAAAAAVLAKYGIRRPYVLYVGRLNARKQLRELILGFGEAKRHAGVVELSLAICGKADFLRYDLEALAREAGCAADLRLCGFVPDDDLPAMYGAAEVFVYPSQFEGMGLPVLEAMACGVPVITSHASSLPEIGGDAALFVDPHDPGAVGDAIARVVQHSDIREALSRRGLEHAKTFTWESTARKTLEVYASVHRESRPWKPR